MVYPLLAHMLMRWFPLSDGGLLSAEACVNRSFDDILPVRALKSPSSRTGMSCSPSIVISSVSLSNRSVPVKLSHLWYSGSMYTHTTVRVLDSSTSISVDDSVWLGCSPSCDLTSAATPPNCRLNSSQYSLSMVNRE